MSEEFDFLSMGLGIGPGLIIGFLGHIWYAKTHEASVAAITKKMKEDAQREAQHIIRDAKVQAKSDVLKMKDEVAKEIKEQRKELTQIEKRLVQREDNLDKKVETLDKKFQNLEKKEDELAEAKEKAKERGAELKEMISKQIDELERVAHLSKEEARSMILTKLESEVKNEAGIMVKNLLDEAKDKAEKKANEVIAYAIQRYASDCVYERTSATIPIPSDELKGRIIGREGRNIRALEAVTGVSILIDDTPGAIVITCFDPVRKEIARQLIERLVADGRIHPTRIEELKAKVEKEVDEKIMEAGEAAILETGIQNVPKQIIKLLGTLQYRYSYSQNVLKHSIESAFFMGAIAAELGLDEIKARRIGLLHDIGKAIDHAHEGTHAKLGAEILRKNGEDPDVVNSVEAHHEETEMKTVYAPLVAACDALSASRPGARSETTELYCKRLEKLEEIAMEFTGVSKCFALQAGRELRVVVEPGEVKEGEAQMIAKDICDKIEKEMNYPGQIKVSVIRETRSVSYAK
jgi:ribonuclease Y